MRVEGLYAVSERRRLTTASSGVVCAVLACAGCGAAVACATATRLADAEAWHGSLVFLRCTTMSTWVLCCGLVATWDLLERRVPIRLTRLLALLTAAIVAARSAGSQHWAPLAGSLLCAVGVGAGCLIWYLARPGRLGFADVRACTLVAGGVGSFSVGAALVVSTVAPFAGALWSGLGGTLTWRQGSQRRPGAPLAALVCAAGAVLVAARAG